MILTTRAKAASVITSSQAFWPAILGLIAIAVSAPAMWVPSKWSDEAATTSAVNRSFDDLWSLVNNIDAVHGVYYALMHVWVSVFGDSAVSMRVPSLIAIGIAAAGVAVIGRQLGGHSLMVAAALSFSILPRVTWAAIEARSYALTIALAVWATAILIRVLRQWSPARWVLYAAVMALAIALNIDVALLLVAHGITVLVWWRGLARAARSLVALVCSGIAAVAVTIPLVVLATQQSEQVSISALTPGYVLNMLGISQFFSGATPVRDRLVPFPPDTVWAVGAVLLAVVGWALIVAGARSRIPSLIGLTLPWIIAPTVIVIGYSALGDNIYTARYLSFTAPAAALLIGAGILGLKTRARMLIVAALVVVLAFPVYFFQRTPTGKQGTDWAVAASIIEANRQPGDAVYWGQQFGSDSAAFTISRIGFAYPDAFGGLPSLTSSGTAAATGSLWGPDRLLRQSIGRLERADRIWAVSDHLGDPSAHPERGGSTFRRHGFRLERSWEGEATDVFLWVRDE